MTDSMNPPQGDVEASPAQYDTDDLGSLLAGAELLRYSDGVGEHDGNIMAVFEIFGGFHLGITMDDSSETPDELVGKRARNIRPYYEIVDGNKNHVAVIEFQGSDSPPIRIRDTDAIGLYKVERR